MEYTEAKKLPSILFFIDFRKAFDNTEWNFIHECIELYNFGPNIRKWISILCNNVESGVMNAVFMTNYFKVSPGVRKRCHLSPLLFVLAVEMLLKIQENQLCRGIELPSGQNAKISQFVDDTTLILEGTTSLTVIKALRLSWITNMTPGRQSLITTSINMMDSFFV